LRAILVNPRLAPEPVTSPAEGEKERKEKGKSPGSTGSWQDDLASLIKEGEKEKKKKGGKSPSSSSYPFLEKERKKEKKRDAYRLLASQ